MNPVCTAANGLNVGCSVMWPENSLKSKMLKLRDAFMP
jgi:hypothetical protein